MKMEYLKSLQVRQRNTQRIVLMFFHVYKYTGFFPVYFTVSQELLSKQLEAKEKNQICLSLNSFSGCPL